MLDVIVYDKIEKKQQLETNLAVEWSCIERLNHYLDLVDFYRKFKSKNISVQKNDEIDWIILDLVKK